MAKQPQTYTAPEAVYQGGKLYAAGEPFVTDGEPNDNWKKIGKAEKSAADAADPTKHSDQSYEGLSVEVLRGIAVEKKVDPQGLSKKDLIAAIKAADEPAL